MIWGLEFGVEPAWALRANDFSKSMFGVRVSGIGQSFGFRFRSRFRVSGKLSDFDSGSDSGVGDHTVDYNLLKSQLAQRK